MSATDFSSTVDDSSLSSQLVVDVLSNERRRFTLHYLLQKKEDETVHLRTLSEQVAAWEHGIEVDAVSYDQRRNVYTALKQHHLPNMDAANIIDYDDARGTIELTTVMSDFDIYMDVVKRDETIPWSEYYLGLGTVLTALTGLLWIDLPPFKYIPPITWAAMIGVIVTLSGIVHVYYNRQTKLGTDGPPPEIREQNLFEAATSYLQRLPIVNRA